MPADMTIGMPITLTADSVTDLYNAVGGSPTGRFVYIWGSIGTPGWSWVRASIESINNSARSMVVTPIDTGENGSHFPIPVTTSLEEAIAIYNDSSTATMRRTTATNMTNPSSPAWAPANELATNVTSLNFDYFDRSGNSISSPSLADIANRARVARIDIQLTVQATQELSNHTRPNSTLTLQCWIRNATIR
jgi:hypothetical protein